MEKEIWKSYPDFENYEFSNYGNFRNTLTGKVMKNSINDKGYISTQLFSKSKQKRIRVTLHRMVALLFLDSPLNEEQVTVNHINGIKNDNYYTNLEWTTNQENIQHSIDTGLRKRSWAQKLNEDDVKECRRLFEETDMGIGGLAKIYNIDPSSVSAILKYKTWFNVDPEKKYSYKINQKNNEEFIKNKIRKTYTIKITPEDVIQNILHDYVNLGLSVPKLMKKYLVSEDRIRNIISTREIPSPILFNDEKILHLTIDTYITNLGRLFKNGLRKYSQYIQYQGKQKQLKNLIAEKYIPNPNDYDCVKHIDGNIENFALHNLDWFTTNPEYHKIHKQNLIQEFIDSKLNKKEFAEKRNFNIKYIRKILKNVKSNKPKAEKIHYVKKGKRPHLCNICQETTPEKFNNGSKGICKSCQNKTKKRKKYNKKDKKPHLCLVCQETNPEKFYAHAKSMCTECYKKKANENYWNKKIKA